MTEKLWQTKQVFYKIAARIFSSRLPSIFYRNILLHPFVLKKYYPKTPNAQQKFAKLDQKDKRVLAEVETELWRTNNLRTYMYTCLEQLKLNNCHTQVSLPVWHLYDKNDRYFDHHIVEQHLRVVYTDYYGFPIRLNKKTNINTLNRKELNALLPTKVRTQLNKKLRE